MEKIIQTESAHDICLLYDLILSSEDSDDLSIGFHPDITTHKRELTNNKNINLSCWKLFEKMFLILQSIRKMLRMR